ncbi:MAG: peptidoglycan DD-metalloendopeptidase family protein [Deltaproteobacteria bacterium]|nr:peptidoglycan DD-metalloendopeptidase family protein [Deltaproteobacteria bacterium]
MNLLFVVILFLSTAQTPVAEWEDFEKAVRDQVITKEEAHRQFPNIYKGLKEICKNHPFNSDTKWLFPVKGYGKKDVGRGGFRPDIYYGSSTIKGYDFYDGNRHGGHPAYDIFIHDKNQDTLDDRTAKPVSVIAPVDVLILSAETAWEKYSEIRGGCYIWALDPLHDQLIYFAHLNEVLVKPGSYIKAGSEIGTVGRSGKNGFPRRSPTHLHLMVLKVDGTSLIPFDYIHYLDKE